MPHEAESITFGFASSMRVASSLGAKPPNTTEWIAPMRAQASIAITASGHHRHVDDDAVALLDAQPPQRSREARHLVAQLEVGEGRARCRSPGES